MKQRAATEEPSAQDVRRQLGRILATRDFRAAPRLAQLLQFLVEARLSRPDLDVSGRDVAASVFHRPADFRNGEDSIVRSSVNRLRRRLTVYYAAAGRRDDVQISIEPGNYAPAFRFRETKAPSGSEQAVALAERYLHVATQASHEAALTLIRRALENAPEDPLLLASFADLSLDAFKHGYDRAYAHVEAAYDAVETAVSIAPDNNRVLLARAMVSLEISDRDSLSASVETLLRSPEDDDVLLGMWFRSIGLGDNVSDRMRVKATSPGWYHLPGFLRHALSGDHEAALNSAIEFSMPGFFWGSMLRASALGHLGLQAAGRRQLENAKRENPYLQANIDDFLACYITSEDARATVVDGVDRLN